MTPTVTISQVCDIETLMPWRMEVLHCVFSIPADADTADLERANRYYYERHLPVGSHIACIASLDGEAVGCGGVCFYEEMPSPDNPCGRCAYLMNICPAYRGKGIAPPLYAGWWDGHWHRAHLRFILKHPMPPASCTPDWASDI